MSEPTMYPSTLFPGFEVQCRDFAELRHRIEEYSEQFHAVISWHLYVPSIPEDFPEYELHEPPDFILLLFTADRGVTTQFRTARFDPDEVEAWIDHYVRARVLRWYGWTAGPLLDGEPEAVAR